MTGVAPAVREKTALGHELAFEAIGTSWSILTSIPVDDGLRERLFGLIDGFDATWSRFRDDSVVRRLAETPGRTAFPAEAPGLFDLYRRLHDATSGSVSPLVGHRLEHLGYDRAYSFTVSADPVAVPTWNDDVVWTGTELVTRIPVLLDVGAAGKGLLVDLVSDLLTDAGRGDHLVDAGGDLSHRGDHPVRVALEHPTDPTSAIGVVTLSNAALAASSPNRRTWGHGVHHVLDAVTGLPTEGVLATWAQAATAAEADGLATALFFASHDRLAAAGFAFESVALRHRTGEVAAGAAQGLVAVEVSPAFSGELFV